jgi:hypothetical protein
MERGKRDARFGRERHDARFGGERRDARFGDSEWLEESGVQGACPLSHHRIYTHIYQVAPGGKHDMFFRISGCGRTYHVS